MDPGSLLLEQLVHLGVFQKISPLIIIIFIIITFLFWGTSIGTPGGVVVAPLAGLRGETLLEFQQRLLKEREGKIRRALEVLRRKRKLLRSARTHKDLPVVSVVGYTNCVSSMP
ncbi:hypothetical protein CRUP_015629 [Coryphaenoides rupestris]|nr:hypothetical protein CRUP_015629 [Coryphaenoides rupestris]